MRMQRYVCSLLRLINLCPANISWILGRDPESCTNHPLKDAKFKPLGQDIPNYRSKDESIVESGDDYS